MVFGWSVLSYMALKAGAQGPLASRSFTRDPARTPKETNLSDPVNTVDGSRGKYRTKHKHPNAHNWARRRGHADLAKPRKNKEKSKNKTNQPGS